MPHGITEHETEAAQGEESAAQQGQHERAQGQFPVAALGLHRFESRSAKTTLHGSLWLQVYASRGFLDSFQFSPNSLQIITLRRSMMNIEPWIGARWNSSPDPPQVSVTHLRAL